MRRHALLTVCLLLATLFFVPAGAQASASRGYLVVLAGTQTASGFDASATDLQIASALRTAGGTVHNDLSDQIGVLVIESPSVDFAGLLMATGVADVVGHDFSWQGIPGGGPEPADDPLEPAQWDMQMIHTDEAHDIQAGAPSVDVGVLDSGIDGDHPDFVKAGVSNVDCARGHNSITFVPAGPGVGTPDVCSDNQFHGTHVAGTIAARANGIGIVGVAPNVTLVPVKVCDATGYCYASAVVDGGSGRG